MKVSKLGTGAEAKATATLKDGKKTKGYIVSSSPDAFVIRDRKTDVATTIPYDDVSRLESNRGHSTAKHVAIGAGVGAGVLVTVLLIIFPHLED